MWGSARSFSSGDQAGQAGFLACEKNAVTNMMMAAALLHEPALRRIKRVLASNDAQLKATMMSQHIQPESSFAEIMDGKKKRREALMLAVSLASPSELEEPSERLKAVMRKQDAEQRRQRIPPPRFAQ